MLTEEPVEMLTTTLTGTPTQTLTVPTGQTMTGMRETVKVVAEPTVASIQSLQLAITLLVDVVLQIQTAYAHSAWV